MRTYDATLIAEASSFFLKSEDKVDSVAWVSNLDNICLVNDQGDLALFEYGPHKQLMGHYFFKSRGRAAIQAATDFLDEIFNSCYNISVLTGLTPLDNPGARWLSRQIGFKSYGIVEYDNEPFELFILTKKEFNRQ